MFNASHVQRVQSSELDNRKKLHNIPFPVPVTTTDWQHPVQYDIRDPLKDIYIITTIVAAATKSFPYANVTFWSTETCTR